MNCFNLKWTPTKMNIKLIAEFYGMSYELFNYKSNWRVRFNLMQENVYKLNI